MDKRERVLTVHYICLEQQTSVQLYPQLVDVCYPTTRWVTPQVDFSHLVVVLFMTMYLVNNKIFAP